MTRPSQKADCPPNPVCNNDRCFGKLFNPRCYPTTEEYANDDTHNYDESSNVQNPSGHMYSLDAPGWDDINICAADGSTYVQNFQEFVRIAIDGPRPLGNGVQGSRASDYYGWYNVGNFVA